MRPQHNAGRVRIDNNNVVSSDGAPLRGAPIWVYGWGKQIGQTAYATDPSYYQRLIEAGLNAIRLVCFDPWQRSNGYPHWDLTVEHDRVGFFDELDRVVAIAIEHGLNVIINYHNSG